MLKPPPLSKRVFDKYDNNKSGKISASEFHNLCYEMGYFLSDKERELAIMQIDTYVWDLRVLFNPWFPRSGDGEIGYNEFLRFWQNDKRFEALQLDEEHQQVVIGNLLSVANNLSIIALGENRSGTFVQICSSLSLQSFRPNSISGIGIKRIKEYLPRIRFGNSRLIYPLHSR